ncbi:MAG: DUF72 domain-containing protein [Massilia sp.]|nr:DUF72 domain-containing protein [Massilia sp.]
MNQSSGSFIVTENRPGTGLVGCAGWAIGRDAAPLLAAGGSQLERYAAVFGAVEITSSFYRSHQSTTYARWADSVPSTFRFSVKLPRSITHEQRLSGIEAHLAQFAAEVSALGDKLGCVLIQLAPSHAFEPAIAANFLMRMRASFTCMIACEARHPSWFTDAASALLAHHGVTRVKADPPKGEPGPHVSTTPAVYLRLHGTPRVYYSSYAEETLAQLADDLAALADAGRDAWLIFDNTAAGAALRNAIAVRRKLMPA